MNLAGLRALILDMDGVLWRGDTALPGLTELFDWLRLRGVPFVLATNNAARTPAHYVDKLAGFGVAVHPDEILTSALATADELARRLPAGSRVFPIGGAGLSEALRDTGFALVADSTGPVAAVVVGFDDTLTYAKLRDACLLIQRGAMFVAANADATFPTESGLIPGAGATVAAIQTATGTVPIVIGKPERPMFASACARLGVALPPPDQLLGSARVDECAMLGDRLDTDIAGAARSGLRSIFVTTGVDLAVLPGGPAPDLVVSGLPELVALWRQAVQAR